MVFLTAKYNTYIDRYITTKFSQFVCMSINEIFKFISESCSHSPGSFYS